MSSLREQVASLCHEQWSGWMKYLFEKGEFKNDVWIMPMWAIDRWTRQMSSPYEELSDEEKESDRAEADKFLDLFEEWREESSIGRSPTWQVFISSDDQVYTVEADCYHMEEDGTLVFLKRRENGSPYPVGVVAPLSWILARRMG